MTTTITTDELDAALTEIAAEQEAWFAAHEKRQQETTEGKNSIDISRRIAVADADRHLKADKSMSYKILSPSMPLISTAVRINFKRARPLY